MQTQVKGEEVARKATSMRLLEQDITGCQEEEDFATASHLRQDAFVL